MTRSDKKFCGSIGVRFCTIRMKIELSPAENHGGPAGRFRVRLDRRWYDLFYIGSSPHFPLSTFRRNELPPRR